MRLFSDSIHNIDVHCYLKFVGRVMIQNYVCDGYGDNTLVILDDVIMQC